MKLAVCLLTCLLSGCVTATITCPVAGPPIEADINSPDITVLAGSILSMLSMAGILAAKPPRRAAVVRPVEPNAGTVTLKTIPIFGKQSIACGPQAPHAVGQ